jgi:NAD+ kinase
MKIAVVVKPGQEHATKCAESCIRFLKKSVPSHEFIFDNETLEKKALSQEYVAKLGSVQIVERNQLTSTADWIIIFGGDGTLLSVARHPALQVGQEKKIPKILGVNFGTLGFLTELSSEEMLSVLPEVLAEKYPFVSHSLLEVTLSNKSKHYALNDIVLTKNALARMFTVEMSVDGSHAITLRGDGVIVSSPLGSTAYSLAAGGSIVHPLVEALLVTPICPHTLTTRPVIIPANSEVELSSPLRDLAGDGEILVTLDGQEGVIISAGEECAIRRSHFQIQMPQIKKNRYFSALSEKLQWGRYTHNQ